MVDPEHAASDRSIRALVERNPGQCTVEEYTRIRDVLRERSPCRALSRGRIQSIYTASHLASGPGETDVFVHDCHRDVERAYCDVYFGDSDLLTTVHHLRHYQVASGAAPPTR